MGYCLTDTVLRKTKVIRSTQALLITLSGREKMCFLNLMICIVLIRLGLIKQNCNTLSSKFEKFTKV